MTSFQNVLSDTTLYPEDFQKLMEESTPKYVMTLQEKESYWRHQMCCLLLSNLEPSSASLANLHEMTSQVISYTKEMDEYDLDMEYRLLDSDDEDIILGRPSQSTLLPIDPLNEGLRFITIETQINPDEIQNTCAQIWGQTPPSKRWDIADIVDKMFIEVKVSTNPPLLMEEFHNSIAGATTHYGIIIIHPEDLTITKSDNVSLPPSGIEKALNFLGRRQLKMNELNLSNKGTDQAETLMVDFTKTKAWKLCKEWMEWTKEVSNLGHQIDETFPPLPLAEITPTILLSHLPPLVGDPALWNHKVPPTPWLESTRTTKAKDREISIDIMEKIVLDCEGEELTKEIRTLLQICITNNYNTLTTPISHVKQCQYILKMLGVGAKKRRVDSQLQDDMEQPQNKPRTRKSHPDWMNALNQSFAESTKRDDFNRHPLTRDEIPGSTPLAQLSIEAASEILLDLINTQVCHDLILTAGMSSRLMGTYSLNIGGSKDNISIFPLLVPIWGVEQVSHRLVYGLVIRGPVHARNETDKIPFIIIVKASDPQIITGRCKNWKCLKGQWVYRENSIMKDIPTYQAFLLNALLPVLNGIGDIVLETHTQREMTARDLKNAVSAAYQTHHKWAKDRLVDMSTMGLIGWTQEEGFFPFRRKMVMMIHQWARGKKVIHLNIADFGKKANEQIIDSLLATHLYEGVRLTLELMIRHSNE
uniref:Polymerase PA n=1 Tax=Neotermes castaneus orthomyxovirus 1 TaxID=3133494 RepID=A0AAT9JH58_9ORTO